MLFLSVNHRAMSVQLDFRHLAFFRVYGKNHMSVQRMRKILADSVYLLLDIKFQCRGWLGMPECHRNFDIAHRIRTPETIVAGKGAGALTRAGYPLPHGISLPSAERCRWSRWTTWKRYADRYMACAHLRWR